MLTCCLLLVWEISPRLFQLLQLIHHAAEDIEPTLPEFCRTDIQLEIQLEQRMLSIVNQSTKFDSINLKARSSTF